MRLIYTIILATLLTACAGTPQDQTCCVVGADAEYCADQMDICQGSDTSIQGEPVRLRAPAYIEMCKRDFNPILCPAELDPELQHTPVEGSR